MTLEQSWDSLTTQQLEAVLPRALETLRAKLAAIREQTRRQTILPGLARQQAEAAVQRYREVRVAVTSRWHRSRDREHEAARSALASANAKAESPTLLQAQAVALQELGGTDPKRLAATLLDPTATPARRRAAGLLIERLSVQEQAHLGGAVLVEWQKGEWRHLTEAQRQAAAMVASYDRMVAEQTAPVTPDDRYLDQECRVAWGAQSVVV